MLFLPFPISKFIPLYKNFYKYPLIFSVSLSLWFTYINKEFLSVKPNLTFLSVWKAELASAQHKQDFFEVCVLSTK